MKELPGTEPLSLPSTSTQLPEKITMKELPGAEPPSLPSTSTQLATKELPGAEPLHLPSTSIHLPEGSGVATPGPTRAQALVKSVCALVKLLNSQA